MNTIEKAKRRLAQNEHAEVIEPCGCMITTITADKIYKHLNQCPLHAAAPELYKALKRVWNEDCGELSLGCVAQIELALKKADGAEGG